MESNKKNNQKNTEKNNEKSNTNSSVKSNTKSNMKLAFFLNLTFTVIELIGGIFTNSVSIMSDAIHDLGDSISIGISIILEKISGKEANEKYTFGYLRYSVLGAMINLSILLVGATVVILNAIPRLLNPQTVNYSGMLYLAIFGLIINGIGVLKTMKSKNINEKVISLHLLEDVLGWAMVLVVSIVIRFSNLYILDPILSLCISAFMIYNVFKSGKSILEIILEKVPQGIEISKIRDVVLKIPDVEDIHHIHIWTMDLNSNYITAHIRVKEGMDNVQIDNVKKEIKHVLEDQNISHATLEMENESFVCNDEKCDIKNDASADKLHSHSH